MLEKNPYKKGDIVFIKSTEATKGKMCVVSEMHKLIGNIGEIEKVDNLFVKVKGWWFYYEDFDYVFEGKIEEPPPKQIVTFNPDNLTI